MVERVEEIVEATLVHLSDVVETSQQRTLAQISPYLLGSKTALETPPRVCAVCC